MRDLDPKSLRLLVAVCDRRNMKLAAEQEHIEPSAVSKRIAQLEDALGTTLLVRSRRGVEPTPAGQALLEHAKTLLHTYQRIESDVAAFSGGIKGHVRVVASISAIAGSLLDDVAAFMREPDNRDIKVDIEERQSVDVVRIVKDGRASLGVCWDAIDLQGLAQHPYRGDRLAVVVSKDHPLAKRQQASFLQTLPFEQVGMPPDSIVHSMLQRAAARANGAVDFRIIVSSFDAAFRVVAAGLAIAVLPSSLAGPYVSAGQVQTVALSDSWARRRFAVCFRDPKALAPAARRMVEYLVNRSGSAEGGSGMKEQQAAGQS